MGISESDGGAKIIDAGIKSKGCLEAGRLITEICMGGLGSVSLSMTNSAPNWPLSIHVHSTDPVLSCLGSQYAGWSLSFVQNDDNFSAFADKVIAKASLAASTDVDTLMEGELEDARSALVQKIGENITVRRIEKISASVVGVYVHSNEKIGVMIGLDGGSQELAKDVAMHVAASNPMVVNPDDVDPGVIEKEKEIFAAQAESSGKPAEIIEKMVGGRIRKFLAEISLVEQPFVKDPDQTVGQLVEAAGARVTGMVRFEVGEGIEKDEIDFAEEVMAQARGSN
ncbi:MAG: translation elongation factor Ts [Gammaproteobacteria bacterium]